MKKQLPGDSSPDKGAVTTRQFESQMSRLVLRRVVGDITIIRGADKISMKVRGESSRIDALDISEEGRTFAVVGDAGRMHTTTVTTVNGVTTVVENGGVVSTGQTSWFRRLLGGLGTHTSSVITTSVGAKLEPVSNYSLRPRQYRCGVRS